MGTTYKYIHVVTSLSGPTSFAANKLASHCIINPTRKFVLYQLQNFGRLCTKASDAPQQKKNHGMSLMSSSLITNVKLRELIKSNTELTRNHMTPEIALYLITKQCPLWSDKGDNSPFTDPFWAFYWPGGQVLTRFILDNPTIFCGQRILDVGSGCGASSIACSMVGATYVIANDVDPVSVEVVQMNCKENQVAIRTDSSNLIGQQNAGWTTILLGDMFYDEKFRDSLVMWLTEHFKDFNSNIFIGDPGRLPLIDHPVKRKLTKVAEYELSETCKEENNGLSVGYVWQLDKG